MIDEATTLGDERLAQTRGTDVAAGDLLSKAEAPLVDEAGDWQRSNNRREDDCRLNCVAWSTTDVSMHLTRLSLKTRIGTDSVDYETCGIPTASTGG